MTEVFVLSGLRCGKMEILSVNATAEGVEKERQFYFSDGSAYTDARIECWVVGE